MNPKQKVFSLVSTLLEYPEPEWKEWAEELDLAKEFPDETTQSLLQPFFAYMEKTPFEDICKDYVYTFDFYDRTTLYLTFAVFKDNRDRGSVLVQLRQQMMKLGMEFTTEELPDYLPLVLEFASIVPEKDSAPILNLHLRSIQNLGMELQGVDSPYRHLISACLHCIGVAKENERVS
ncbi:nitrate reductase molybdenum cofactor assembly chaperone [Bacillus niameyensis]|uniref:nitrate reductase molybdenum cofactor assembly chaperone n=1 Tax=Bacillus niameyensis TaxID=1522308 RepID=UPI000782739A|nr:nitrate reductase molybdenum cofactor assembly chaperone [Bacillus niameyensis]